MTREIINPPSGVISSETLDKVFMGGIGTSVGKGMSVDGGISVGSTSSVGRLVSIWSAISVGGAGVLVSLTLVEVNWGISTAAVCVYTPEINVSNAKVRFGVGVKAGVDIRLQANIEHATIAKLIRSFCLMTIPSRC